MQLLKIINIWGIKKFAVTVDALMQSEFCPVCHARHGKYPWVSFRFMAAHRTSQPLRCRRTVRPLDILFSESVWVISFHIKGAVPLIRCRVI